jgi:hypothetical protein
MMALHWFIDSRKRLIVVTAERPVSRADIDGLLDAVRAPRRCLTASSSTRRPADSPWAPSTCWPSAQG